MKKTRAACAAVFALLPVTPVFGTVIGTTTIQAHNQIEYHSPMGQTFTSVDSFLDMASFFVSPMNPSFPLDGLVATLYAGDGFAGTVLVSDTKFPTDGYSGWYDFSLGGIAVTPGEIYTLQLATTSGSPYWAAASTWDDYGGGHAWVYGNGTYSDMDWTFQVMGTVPEPSALVLLGYGLIVVVHKLRRKA